MGFYGEEWIVWDLEIGIWSKKYLLITHLLMWVVPSGLWMLQVIQESLLVNRLTAEFLNVADRQSCRLFDRLIIQNR